MYISVDNCFELDKILKSFEVAYRSYIADKLINKYPDLNSFSIDINKLDSSIQNSSILFSNKYKQKITKIKKEIGPYYAKLNDCNETTKNKNYDNDVPYVSEIIDFVTLFFDGIFNSLAFGFASIEEFNNLNNKYNLVRNWLSHPASCQITTENAKNTINFIKKTSANIPFEFHWYVTNHQLMKWCNSILENIDNTSLKYHNLSDISFSHQKLLEREDEILLLKSFMFGKNIGYRKSGSVVIYGYGGVGKTALVLEFLYRIAKDLNENQFSEKVDFLMFFSAKEELLTFTETTKKLYIKDIRKQIVSFEDFIANLNDSLELKKDEDINKYSGIIVIDNFETLLDSEKPKFYDYIKSVSRNIQFILTSRNEEPCEDKINLKEFDDIKRGVRFINEFIDYHNLKVIINNHEKETLIELSKGNTLIIVLSLQFLTNSYTIKDIFRDLENVESSNIEIICDFMYKNTIEHAIDYLKEKKHEPIELLKVISLYDIPVDLYSLSKISGLTIQNAEFICEYLSSKLILEKNGETFKTNDFANKFIVSKFLPNRIELKFLKEKIRDHQKELDSKLKKLVDTRSKEPLLNSIMDDWKPKNSIDTIAISEAFSYFGRIKKSVEAKNQEEIILISKEFERLEKMTSHPYIRFQKARCFQHIYKNEVNPEKKKQLEINISKYYEDAIDTTDFYYPYIKNTKSYASINWIYGIFIYNVIGNIEKSLRYFEDAVFLFRKVGVNDKAYFTALNNLSWTYSKLYSINRNPAYLIELKTLYEEVLENKIKLIAMSFDYTLYIENFGIFFKNKPIINSNMKKHISTNKKLVLIKKEHKK